MLVIICGLPGVGKTTVAKNLAPLIDASILSMLSVATIRRSFSVSDIFVVPSSDSRLTVGLQCKCDLRSIRCTEDTESCQVTVAL